MFPFYAHNLDELPTYREKKSLEHESLFNTKLDDEIL